MEERTFVIVYKGLGHQALVCRIPSVGLSVYRLVHYLEHHSDWLWGVGKSFKQSGEDIECDSSTVFNGTCDSCKLHAKKDA